MLRPSSRGGVPKRYKANNYFVNADKWVNSISQYGLQVSTTVITILKELITGKGLLHSEIQFITHYGNIRKKCLAVK